MQINETLNSRYLYDITSEDATFYISSFPASYLESVRSCREDLLEIADVLNEKNEKAILELVQFTIGTGDSFINSSNGFWFNFDRLIFGEEYKKELFSPFKEFDYTKFVFL